MQDLKTSILLEMADSQLTTKGVFVIGGASVADQWVQYMPMFFSMTGSAIAGLAGIWLFMRHRAQYKLAKLTAIKTQLEIDEILRRRADST